MAKERSNIEGYWDEFADWCYENGIDLDHEEDWGNWWECWCSALDAQEAYTI